MNTAQYEILNKVSTSNIADALDYFNLKGATWGVRPTYEACKKIFGEAVTLRLIPASTTVPKYHLGQLAIHHAKAGDVIVIDNAGRLDTSCWGGVLSTAAAYKKISGVIIDGACRDIDDYIDQDFPVYSKGSVTTSARGRVVEDATNIPIRFCGVLVNPGDVIMADKSGVVCIQQSRLTEVLNKSQELFERENAICEELLAGEDNMVLDSKYNYNLMLEL